MRILFVVDSLDYGGVARQLTLLIPQLVGKRIETHLCVLGHETPWTRLLSSRGVDVTALHWNRILDGRPLWRLRQIVRELQPDLVLTQDLCAVCAVPAGHVTEALSLLGSPAEVVSLDPGSLGEVLDCLLQVGRVTGTLPRAQAVVDGLNARLAAVAAAVAGLPRPRTFGLEWSDPPFNAGHWVPEMIELAGGESVLSSPGIPSVRVTWEQIAEADPQVVVFMPCGYGLEDGAREAEGLLARPELARVTSLFAVDASAHFSRPGPRLVDGVEILAAALHPEVFHTEGRHLIRVRRG